MTNAFASLVALAAFGLAVGAPCTAAAESTMLRAARISEDLEVTELRPGVWMHTTWRTFENGVRFPSNGLVVVGRDATVLVDTAWGAEPTALLLDWLEEQLALTIDQAVVTHFHDDRMGGAPVLEERGIPLYGAALTRELVATGDAHPLHVLEELTVGESVALGPVEVFSPGPAHTRDNLAVWVPEAGVLFGGCAVRPASASSLGNTADAAVEEWPASIRRMQERYPDAEIVVPSHGDPGGYDLLAHTLAVLSQHR